LKCSRTTAYLGQHLPQVMQDDFQIGREGGVLKDRERDGLLFGSGGRFESRPAASIVRRQMLPALEIWPRREVPIHGNGPTRSLDRGRGVGERHHRTALEQPDQPGLVVPAQGRVAGVRLGRELVQAK